MFLPLLAEAINGIRYSSLGISPVIHDFGFFELRWYSLAYIAGILLGWWYLLKLLAQPGAPMARRHADDLVFYVTLGILLGGRLGYVLFYDPAIVYDRQYGFHPLDILKLWTGGMSLHGGVIGVSIGLFWLARRNGLSWLRIHDYVACCVPFGLFFGRVANFINGELWGGVTSVPWAVRFPEVENGLLMDGPPRHPSQLYEAGLEGIVLFLILAWLFWRTDARYQPGRLVGSFLLCYGLFRFGLEFIREPDQQLVWLARETGLHMGQWLCLPMIAGGAYLVATAKRRRVRVEPIAGTASIA